LFQDIIASEDGIKEAFLKKKFALTFVSHKYNRNY